MNKNIILGIVAAGIVIGALYLLWDNDIITPIDEANFSGSWKQTVVIYYADGTSKTMGDTEMTATLIHDGSPINMISPHLYLNPTSVSTPDTVEIDIVNLDLLYSVSGTAIDNGNIGLTTESVGFRPFSLNTGFQEVGYGSVPLSALEGLVIPYDDDYVLTMWYEGDVVYRIPSIDNTEYTTPAPVGELIFEFSSIQGATIINFDWNTDIEVS